MLPKDNHHLRLADPLKLCSTAMAMGNVDGFGSQSLTVTHSILLNETDGVNTLLCSQTADSPENFATDVVQDLSPLNEDSFFLQSP